MVEEILDVFDANRVMLEEGGFKQACTFFVTDRRMVVMVPEGMNPWTGILAVIAFAVSLVGFFLRDLTLIIVGLGAGFAVVFLLVLVNFAVRRRRRSRAKRLAPDEILMLSKQNFEIPYSDVNRFKHEEVEMYEPPSVSRMFLPRLPYKTHVIEFETREGRYVFNMEGSEITPFVDLMMRFIPEKIEEPKSED